MNYGAWNYVRPRLNNLLNSLGRDEAAYNGRPCRASTASGYMSLHKSELASLLEKAMS
jgi:2-oxoglutarate dehydrogenase E1 component